MSGFCTSIPVNRLSNEARSIVQEAFDLEDDSLLMEVDEEEEMNPAASQDFPMFSQSQSSETLKVCDLCDFKGLNDADLKMHKEQEHCKPTDGGLAKRLNLSPELYQKFVDTINNITNKYLLEVLGVVRWN